MKDACPREDGSLIMRKSIGIEVVYGELAAMPMICSVARSEAMSVIAEGIAKIPRPRIDVGIPR
jgi:hypothetical protein